MDSTNHKIVDDVRILAKVICTGEQNNTGLKKKRSGKQKRNTNNEIGSSDKANTCKIKRHNDFGNSDNSTVIVMTTIMITLSC